MKRIEINLYPYQPKEENKYIKKIEKYTPFVFLGAVGFIVINVILFSITASMTFPYHKLSLQWKQLQPKIGEIDTLKKELDSLKQKEKKCRSVLTYKMNTSRVLAVVYSSLPKNIWLSQMRFDKGIARIIGYAVEWKKPALVSIDMFTKRLKEIEYFHDIFSKIILKSSRKTVFNTKEVMRFEIECRK